MNNSGSDNQCAIEHPKGLLASDVSGDVALPNHILRVVGIRASFNVKFNSKLSSEEHYFTNLRVNSRM